MVSPWSREKQKKSTELLKDKTMSFYLLQNCLYHPSSFSAPLLFFFGVIGLISSLSFFLNQFNSHPICSPRPGMEPGASALGAQSLSHGTTMGVPLLESLWVCRHLSCTSLEMWSISWWEGAWGCQVAAIVIVLLGGRLTLAQAAVHQSRACSGRGRLPGCLLSAHPAWQAFPG